MFSYYGQPVSVFFLMCMAVVVFSLVYMATLMVQAIFRKPTWEPRDYTTYTGNKPDVIFVMPCLNEATVIGASVDRLLKMTYEKLHIVVIDDGSDDGTADVVRTFDDPRVHLYQRSLPNARKGKGKALNDAFQFIYNGGIIPNIDQTNCVLVVVDADGRMDTESLDYVLPAFDDPLLSSVQIGVRINNRTSNLLARMQDLEFVLFTEVFQRGRVKFDSVGLGGNGQFVRLSALRMLGTNPWSDSLTEDLDLGIRLHLVGTRLDYCPEVAVHQQGLVSLKRWIRQRTRWFQGYLQGWSHIGPVLTRLWGTKRLDLFIVLTSPLLLLVATFFTMSFLFSMLAFTLEYFLGNNLFTPLFVLVYFLAFGPALILSLIYRKQESDLSLIKAFALGHVYVFYAQLWGIAGWKAVWNQLRGKTGWAKTERVAEEPVEETEVQLAIEPGQSALDNPVLQGSGARRVPQTSDLQRGQTI